MNMILAEYMKFDLKNMLKMRICCFSKQLFNMRKMMQLMSTRIQINKVFFVKTKVEIRVQDCFRLLVRNDSGRGPNSDIRSKASISSIH